MCFRVQSRSIFSHSRRTVSRNFPRFLDQLEISLLFLLLESACTEIGVVRSSLIFLVFIFHSYRAWFGESTTTRIICYIKCKLVIYISYTSIKSFLKINIKSISNCFYVRDCKLASANARWITISEKVIKEKVQFSVMRRNCFNGVSIKINCYGSILDCHSTTRCICRTWNNQFQSSSQNNN